MGLSSAGAPAVLAAALLSAAGDASSCDEHSQVRVEIGALPAALAGMRFEFHHTVGPQLVLANPTERTVELVDEDGASFARVGPRGVEANLHAASWYTSYAPAARVPDVAHEGRAPRWERVGDEPSFGWLEPRLDRSSVAVPEDPAAAREPIELGRWSLPLRVDGRPVSLEGRFVWTPAPAGALRVRLASKTEIAPGVRVRVLPGKAPGLLVENASGRELRVPGPGGEPFLAIGPRGVEANVASPAWRASGRSATSSIRPAADGDPAWTRVSHAPRFGWIDARVGAGAPPSGETSAWQVPMWLGDERLVVRGEATWRAAAPAL